MKPVEFGKYLRGIRKEKKLTVRQLDLYSGVSHSYISQMERGIRGVPSPEILRKLSKPLGVEYEELMVKAGYMIDFEPDQDLKREVIDYLNTEESKDFTSTLDMSDEELFDKYNFVYDGDKPFDEDMIKAFRSYIRFIINERENRN